MKVDAEDVIHIRHLDFANPMHPGQSDIVDDAVEGIPLCEINEGLADASSSSRSIETSVPGKLGSGLWATPTA